MSYPRNNASPERIAVGAVVQISDGAVQSSGVSISVRGQGGASGAGAGTTAYDNGIVQYTPTQAETDVTSFVIVAYKTGCIPASVTVVTGAGSTAGVVALPSTATIAITGNITGNLSGSVGSVTGAVGSVTGAVGSVTGLTNATIADAVLDEALAGHLTLGSFGYYVGEIHATGDLLYTDWEDGGRLDLILDARAAAATALSTATWTPTRAGYLDNLSGGAVMLASSYSAPPSAATISTQVASDLAAAHGSGSWATATGFSTLDAAGVRSAVGLATANLDTQLADLPTVAEFEARTLVSASYGTAANQAIIAAYLDTEVAAILAAVDTEVGAIKAKTDQLTFTVANQVDANTLTIVGTADDAVLSAIAALNNLSAAQVNAECDSALSDAGVTTARMAALADWIDGGRLDLLLDAILDDTGTAGVALSAAICNKVADHVRRRTQANVEASSDGDTLSLLSEYGAIQQIQQSAASGATLTVKKTDTTTTLGTRTLATNAGSDPVTGVS